MTEAQASNFAKVLAECAKTSEDAVQNVEKFLSSLKSADNDREGIGLFEVKNRELLAYIMEMTFLMERMSAGQSIASSEAFQRAALHRTVLEKIKPIEQKLASQVDKLTKKQSDPTKKESNLKPRLDQMEFDDDENESDNEDEEGEGEEEGRPKKYVPPKMMAVHYDEESDKKSKAVARSRRRAMQSSLIQELKEQYSEAPEEYRDVSKRDWEREKEKERYEEDNLVRLKVTRAEKVRAAKHKNENAVDNLLNFGSYMVRDESGSGPAHKRKRAKPGDGPSHKRPRNKVEKRKIKNLKNKAKQRAIMRRT